MAGPSTGKSRGQAGGHGKTSPPELEELRRLDTELATGELTPEHLTRLGSLLQGASALVAARAAHVLRRHGNEHTLVLLEEAAETWLERKGTRDPGCLAKAALIQAMVEGESRRSTLYHRALDTFQPEPVWGGRVDAAAGLRALAAEGLLACDDSSRMDCWARLLADPEPEARGGALRALGASGDPAALPLLRYKCLIGDAEPDLLRAALLALLGLLGPDGIPFVAAELAGRDAERRRAAALALCDAGRAEALLPVFELLEHEPEGEFRELLRLALAGSGLPEAKQFLLEELRTGRLPAARGALEALLALRGDTDLAAAVADVLAARGSRELEQMWRIHLLETREDEPWSED